MKNKSLIIKKPLDCRIIDQGLPDVSDNDVLIKVEAAGICGTDIHIYEGTYIGDYPVIPGHEFSGVVVDIGQKVSRIKKGDHVAVEPNIPCNNCDYCLNNKQNFCMNWQAIGVTLPGGMAAFVKAPESAVFPINDLSFDKAAFMEPLSCVLHGIEKLNPVCGGKGLVIGAGPIGLLIYQILKMKGCSTIYIVDKDKQRADFSSQFGAESIFYNVDMIKNKDFDLVVDATGIPEIMSLTIDFVRPGGEILLFGVPPVGKKLTLDAFHIFRKGLKIVSSFTSVRNSLQALSILESDLINVSDLITQRLSLEEFEKAVELIKEKTEFSMKVLMIP